MLSVYEIFYVLIWLLAVLEPSPFPPTPSASIPTTEERMGCDWRYKKKKNYKKKERGSEGERESFPVQQS